MEKLRLKREALQKEPGETTSLGELRMPPFNEERDTSSAAVLNNNLN